MQRSAKTLWPRTVRGPPIYMLTVTLLFASCRVLCRDVQELQERGLFNYLMCAGSCTKHTGPGPRGTTPKTRKTLLKVIEQLVVHRVAQSARAPIYIYMLLLLLQLAGLALDLGVSRGSARAPYIYICSCCCCKCCCYQRSAETLSANSLPLPHRGLGSSSKH